MDFKIVVLSVDGVLRRGVEVELERSELLLGLILLGQLDASILQLRGRH